MRKSFVENLFKIIRRKKPLHLYKSKYDAICSLGYNCEISFRLEDLCVWGIDSYLFSWANIKDNNKFLLAIDNLEDLYSEEYGLQPNGMALSPKYSIAFHLRRNKYKFLNSDKTINNGELNLALKELQSRLKYLGKKTEKIFSKKSCAFVIKLKSGQEHYVFLKELYNFISYKMKKKKFKLICVFEAGYKKEELERIKALENDNFVIEIVNEFAADFDTKNTGDIIGWHKILKRHLFSFYL
jgi:hypothetical protein